MSSCCCLPERLGFSRLEKRTDTIEREQKLKRLFHKLYGIVLTEV